MAEDIRPQTAIRAAKDWLREVYAEELISNIALEEVRFRDGKWEITLAFSRAEAQPEKEGLANSLESVTPDNPLALALRSIASRRRVYKVVVVAGNDNHVMEMRDREVA